MKLFKKKIKNNPNIETGIVLCASKRETSLIGAQKYGEHVKPNIVRSKSLLSAQKYGLYKLNDNEEEMEK